MSEQPEEFEPITYDHNAEPTTYSEELADLDLTGEEKRDAEWNLDDPEAVDDVPWSPPERRPLGSVFIDMGTEETIEHRIRQEEPEAGTAYGAPSRGGEADDLPGGKVEMIGGDDPDAIPAEQDWLGGTE